jgi:ABC-type multidrug transport system fused ATPase/permease subunit
VIYEVLSFAHRFRIALITGTCFALFTAAILLFSDTPPLGVSVICVTVLVFVMLVWFAMEQLGLFLDTQKVRKYFEKRLEEQEEAKRQARTKKVPVNKIRKYPLTYKEVDNLTQADVDRRFKIVEELIRKRKKKKKNNEE